METKVCGVTKVEQALLMEAMGVKYIGLNFVKSSSRYVTPEVAEEIVSELSPDTKAVGVFMNHGTQAVQEIADQVGLDMIQYHGAEPVTDLKSQDLPTIKVFAVDAEFDPKSILAYEDVADYFLFDAKVGAQTGGTGQAFDWEILNEIQTDTPYFLAGGLGPHNLEEAKNNTKAFAVDLNSKIETKPGVKDLELLKECFAILND